MPTKEAPAALHVAEIGKEIYVSANEDYLKNSSTKPRPQESRRKKPEESDRESNAGLFISPSNARAAASLFLEHEGHSLARLNNPVWNCFYQTGVLAPDASDSMRQQTAGSWGSFR